MKQQIVDKDDNLIAVKERDQIDYKTDIYRVAALWLTNSNGEVLIAQRKLSKDKDPGLWGPAAAGTVEEGETYESNIYKEAQEEIGLEGIKFEKGPRLFIHRPRTFFCQWYTAACDWPANKFIPQETEVEKVEWIHGERLARDIRQHPQKYVSQMPIIAEKFL